ncbi:hypothetical protein FKW77_006648 [Venturia effusa]|uniref:AB hydrolase-1 domain-containing protein n=1 Tax=Venturia effusa TaxID=50376 RepID=A0A517LCG3_9PEZI|nr:hypothetical protein FKW77_006648 [Venturia effusa]
MHYLSTLIAVAALLGTSSAQVDPRCKVGGGINPFLACRNIQPTPGGTPVYVTTDDTKKCCPAGSCYINNRHFTKNKATREPIREPQEISQTGRQLSFISFPFNRITTFPIRNLTQSSQEHSEQMPQISFFRPSTPPQTPLPPGITRSYIQTPSGPLELLVALPASRNNPPTSPSQNRAADATRIPKRTPLFFAHGGCGSAAVWIPYMQFFSREHQIPCYALSYRGHGASWYPNFLRMFFTRMSTLAEDLARGLAYVRETAGEEVVVVGHSSGGGLVQFCLDKGRVGGVGVGKVKGVALAGSIPGFGSLGVNLNWFFLDKWFLPRMLFKHFGHPMSPLSSTALVKQVFFSPEYPLSSVAQFESLMPRYESFLWPNGMLFRFVNFQNVLKRISGKGHGSRILILAGERDRLVSLDIAKREAEEYRSVFRELAKTNRLKAEVDDVVEEEGESTGCGVQFRVVDGAGHHFMNDLMWEEGAEKLLDFYEQL